MTKRIALENAVVEMMSEHVDDKGNYWVVPIADKIEQLIKSEQKRLIDEVLAGVGGQIEIDTHSCRFKAHTVKPEAEGFKDYSSLPDSWYTCKCGRKMKNMKVYHPNPAIESYNNVTQSISNHIKSVAERYGLDG